jgi:cation:H+ antiporter
MQILNYVYVLAGMALLYFGGESLVNNSVTLARSWGVSTIVVGLTVVAFGTSSPELATSLIAALQGSPEISVGNVIGSNIFNVLGILGITAVVTSIKVQSQFIRREVPIMIGVTLLLFPLMLNGHLGRLEGVILFALLVAYIIFVYLASSGDSVLKSETDQEYQGGEASWKTYVGVLIGLVLLGVGARILVLGATGIARGFGVSELMIGLTIVAAGTSMPEVAASIVAALKKEPDIALGNVIGSSIFNVLCILGITVMVSPISMPWATIQRDMWVLLGVSVLLWPFLFSGRRLSRLEGILFLLGYIAYVYMLIRSST